jgi:hypothetical protein
MRRHDIIVFVNSYIFYFKFSWVSFVLLLSFFKILSVAVYLKVNFSWLFPQSLVQLVMIRQTNFIDFSIGSANLTPFFLNLNTKWPCNSQYSHFLIFYKSISHEMVYWRLWIHCHRLIVALRISDVLVALVVFYDWLFL